MLAYLMTWMQLRADRRAVTALEYGLIAGLIGSVIVLSVTSVGTALTAKFTAIAGSI
jgi:pilus assembly protein Flp/PilA